MNTNQEKTKNGVIKALAIIGLISVVVLAIWASVQIIRVLPSAFSSLASVADTVYKNQPVDSLTVATEKNITNSGESLKVSWTDLERAGEYSFYYTCTEGVSVDIRTTSGDTSSVRCGSPTLLPEGSTSFDMIVNSERRRFIDVPFTIAFTAASDDEVLFERNSKVTVVNATIPQSVDVAIENGEEPEEEETETDTTDESDTPATTPSTPGTTETTQTQTITYIPESNPNGFTDLKVTYLGVGVLDDGDFIPTAAIDSDERGAIRFEVRNIGTKTSDDWTFDATLPTGFVFESNEQAPLKPNERAVYTLGFSVTGADGIEMIEVELDVPGDTNSANDSFDWAVEISD